MKKKCRNEREKEKKNGKDFWQVFDNCLSYRLFEVYLIMFRLEIVE